MKPLDVIYVDNHLLVVNKPAGVLSQADATGDPCLLEQARAWIKSEYDKPGNVFVGLVHRLDRPVCGVMVFARTSKSASRLSAQLRARTISKTYEAVVIRPPARASGVLEDVLDGRDCRLEYTALGLRRAGCLLEVRPQTGRKHQIRRQLAAHGTPIVGDTRYGAPRRLANRAIALRAVRIAFDHPTQKHRLSFEVPAPSWWPE